MSGAFFAPLLSGSFTFPESRINQVSPTVTPPLPPQCHLCVRCICILMECVLMRAGRAAARHIGGAIAVPRHHPCAHQRPQPPPLGRQHRRARALRLGEGPCPHRDADADEHPEQEAGRDLQALPALGAGRRRHGSGPLTTPRAPQAPRAPAFKKQPQRRR